MSGGSWKSSTFTTEFGHEFEAERGRWLRRRFLWYTGVIGAFNTLAVIGGAIAMAFETTGESWNQAILNFSVGLATTLLYVGAFQYVRRRPVTQVVVLRMASRLIIAAGLISLGSAVIAVEALPESAGVKKLPAMVLASIGVMQIFSTHFVACLFLPWTPRESFRPLVPLLVVNAVLVLLYTRAPVMLGLTVGLSPLVGLPGAAICWWRNSRFKDRFALSMLRGRYMELRHELTNARQIHESLFPQPCPSGSVMFSYVYEPMRQIGGDYLYASFTPGVSGQAALNMVLVDVTGHGIPAALTVNRLHGELERIFAENPGSGPGDVLTLLNRYVHLTLATHSVYVTAVCFRADPGACTLEYASGGHPPAFLRAVDGTIEQLDSTAFVLGACAGEDFKSEPRTLRFSSGDTLVAYTDGAIEARDSMGKFLGVAGIQKLLAMSGPAPNGGWPATILKTVEQHRQGPPADDTLVVEIHRPLEAAKTRTGVAKDAAAAR